jgi:hypothetical protein
MRESRNLKTRWRMVQSDANLSLRPNSLLAGENCREFLPFRPQIWQRPRKSIELQGVLDMIPYSTEQGITIAEQGKSKAMAGVAVLAETQRTVLTSIGENPFGWRPVELEELG